jgi:hypothetical protein
VKVNRKGGGETGLVRTGIFQPPEEWTFVEDAAEPAADRLDYLVLKVD